MGLTTNTTFIKIRNKVIDNSISIATLKMPSFDPRGLGLTFTDTERAYLKRYWNNHWQLGFKGRLVEQVTNQYRQDYIREILVGSLKPLRQEVITHLTGQGETDDYAKQLFLDSLQALIKEYS